MYNVYLSCRYVQSLENSFSGEQLKLFVQMLYQLLLTDQYPFKTKRMLVHGPPDSGKTTWVEPILAVLDETKIASVTREGKFSCHLIKDNTQVLFVDEWDPKSMQVDEAKCIFQGGRQIIPQKHGEAIRLNYNSGVYITCNNVSIFICFIV